LAYCCDITHDKQEAYYTNSKLVFKWVDIAKSSIRIFLANKESWENWAKDTSKNKATKDIFNICAKHGLEIRPIKEAEQIWPECE
jgi:hypothetical protein